MNKYQKQLSILRQALKIEQAASISFVDKKSENYKKFEDTACTALVRCIKFGAQTFIDRKNGQLCSGADYFLGIKDLPSEEISSIYIKEEKVFENEKSCNPFLKNLPKYPTRLNKKYILLTPFELEVKKPDIIILLANPAQVSRILGLSVFKDFKIPHIVPAGPTCLSLYAPLITNSVHLNFIDYFDRYYQCVNNGGSVFGDSEMVVSLPYSLFSDIIDCVEKSSHGLFQPNLRPQKITKLCQNQS